MENASEYIPMNKTKLNITTGPGAEIGPSVHLLIPIFDNAIKYQYITIFLL